MNITPKPEHYAMYIQWNPQDNNYVVTLPEFPGCRTHGKTHERAIKHGLELIELCLKVAQDEGEPIPVPMPVDDEDEDEADSPADDDADSN